MRRVPNQSYDLYWFEQRRKANAFEQAAEEAKREIFPELFFSDYEPSITLCRVCEGEGYHKEGCKLRHPDGKDKAEVDDVIRVAADEEQKKKSLIDYERERLEKLGVKPADKKKVEEVEKATPPPADSK